MSDNWYLKCTDESVAAAEARKAADFTAMMERVTGEVPDLVNVLKDPADNHIVNKAIASLFKPGALAANHD